MPNQCIHCSAVYEDGARETLQGCAQCGSKFFFYMTAEKMIKIQQARGAPLGDLTSDDKTQIEQDVREIAGITEAEAPIILDFETVKITSPGKYILDVPNLFSKKRPLVYKLEDGKYVIDIVSTINKQNGK